MTFQPNIPLATDIISISQGDLKNNFGSLSTAWDVNHNDFNVANAGKHKFAEFPNQLADPATAAAETTIYAKDVSGSSRLFYREESSGTVRQFTGPIVAASPGSTFLPGGIIIKWGLAGSVGDNAVISFVNPFPNNCFSVTVSQVAASIPSSSFVVKDGSVGTSSFTVRVQGTVSLYYQAIGN
jgi:hypothetical protein